jgi:bifunctional non-homologous end joining protein LigD
MCPSTPAQCCRCLSRPVRPSPDLWLRMLWRVSRPLRSRSKPDGFILPCQSALADRPPAGPGWLHEIKFDGYRIIARKDGEQVHLWARTTSDYSNTFTRIRDAVAALPVHNAVLDGEAIVLRLDATSDFEALRSRQGRQRRSRHLQ